MLRLVSRFHVTSSLTAGSHFPVLSLLNDKRARILESLDYIINAAIPVYLNADGSATPLVHRCPSLGSVHSGAVCACRDSTLLDDAVSSFYARSIPPPRTLHARNLGVPLAPLRTPITCTFLERAASPIFIAAETCRAQRGLLLSTLRSRELRTAPRGKLGRFYTRPSDLSVHRCIIHLQRAECRG